MIGLTEVELAGLEPVIDARKMTFDVSDKYENIVIPIGNAGESLRSVRIYYHLVVSDPPVKSTFNDVPVDHPFFQYIEALAASGVTGGCGNNNYCPDQALTRGQMAVFLAKALGLYFSF